MAIPLVGVVNRRNHLSRRILELYPPFHEYLEGSQIFSASRLVSGSQAAVQGMPNPADFDRGLHLEIAHDEAKDMPNARVPDAVAEKEVILAKKRADDAATRAREA